MRHSSVSLLCSFLYGKRSFCCSITIAMLSLLLQSCSLYAREHVLTTSAAPI